MDDRFVRPRPVETAPVRSTNEPGFAEATVLIGSNTAQKSGGAGRNIVVLFEEVSPAIAAADNSVAVITVSNVFMVSLLVGN